MDEADVDGLAAALGVALREEWRAGVVLNLRVCLAMGALVAGFDVGDEAGVAGVFEP